MSFLTLDSLTRHFGDFVAVDDLNLSIVRGEFISLLGPSGCGKTTTLQMIAGLLEPTAGRILLDGADITRTPPNKRGLGIVFQSYALFPHMTAAENVAFGLEMRRVPRAERMRRTRTALAQVKLDRFAERYPKEMSGGQRQRVALARALVVEPPILLLDEPLSNLDAKLRGEMRIELRLLQQEIGVTTILVTHDQEEALSMSDRVVVMNHGRVAQVAAPLDMYERPDNAFVSDFVGKTNLLSGVVERVDATSADVRIGEAVLTFPGAAPAAGELVSVSIRPEKLHLSRRGEGLPVEIEASIFLGAYWLYRVRAPIGELFVAEPNHGEPGYARGEKAVLDWRPGAALMLSVERDHG